MGNANNAYITKQANTVNPSDWINKQEQIGLQYDAIARQKEKDEQARQDALRKEFKDDTSFEIDMSGSGNGFVDKEVLAPLLMQDLTSNKNAIEEMESAMVHGLNSPEYKSAKRKLDRINKRSGMYRLGINNLVEKMNSQQKLLADEKIYQRPSDLEALQNFSKSSIKVNETEDGRQLFEKNGKVYENVSDLIDDNLKFGKPIYKVKSDDIIFGVTDKVGTKEYMDRMGYTTNTVTNPWEDYTDPNSNEKKKGIKSVLTNAFESALTDEVVESVLAGKGEFGYDEMPQETKDKLKAGIVNDWLEIGRGQIEEKTGVKFDSSRYNQDSRNKNNNSDGTSSFTHIEDTYSNGNYHTSVYAPSEPIVPKNTNKAANPVTYDGIIYDDESKTISLTGRKLTNNNKSPEFAEYKKLAQEASKANIKWQNNKDEAIEEQLSSEYFALESQVDIALESLKTVKGAWEETTVTDKRQVATLLKGTLNANSYDEMVKILSRKEKQKEKQKEKESEETERPNLEELPDLP